MNFHPKALLLAIYISGDQNPEQSHFTLLVCCNDPKITENLDSLYLERSVCRLPSQALAPYRLHDRDWIGRDYYLRKDKKFIKAGDVITGFTIVGAKAPKSPKDPGSVRVLGDGEYPLKHFGLNWWVP